jgi:hypothetical protein
VIVRTAFYSQAVSVVIVSPGPVFLLLVLVQLAEVAMVAMGLHDPLVVIDGFPSIPAVVVVVVGIVDAIGAICAPGSDARYQKSEWPATENSNIGILDA